MLKIETIRHSLAHILGLAIQELYPGVKFGIGPAIQDGFYYDFDFNQKSGLQTKNLGLENLPRIEKKMKEIIKQDIDFKKKEMSVKQAIEFFKKRKQYYKIELIKDLAQKKGKIISIYESGKFTDLCAGPHIKSTIQLHSGDTKEIINSFRLTRIAGAYWKGDEKNKMLTRIYGIAFQTKKELADYLKLQKEKEQRDHREIGKKLDLFHISEEIGPGLVLWHPRGAILKKIIEDYILEKYLKNDYELVSTPHIAKIGLWETSGHTNFYKENMFPLMHMQELEKDEKDNYEIKPMNCPFHISIYKQKIRSYKDLPIRYTELGTVYRYERSGVLHGLTRVRGFTQDDAHIWCAKEQLDKELILAFKLCFEVLKTFGFKKYDIYLSTMPKKHVGTLKNWEKATNSLKYSLKKVGLKYEIDPGEGVFYGPKVDIKIKDSLGRAWQCTTIQVDFNLPNNFEMTYINKKGKKEQPIMIHRAILGSLERFIGVLLENYGGALPFWLAPEQIWIIPISSKEKTYAKKIAKELFSFRAKVKDENETVSKKIREASIQKIPYALVIGKKEMKEKTIRIRQREKGDIGEMKLSMFIKKINADTKSKK
ncbi:MAG: threonine--tRNA ligase [Patescibacteria group bacterium]|nr:threonine--tRNA ligase [Patescibacteria group bacterium]